ncbi:MAG: hypothetical protein EPN88_09735 [Bacteroidetes bacterium]|nr:MAG: hypothetical protein EPN88_09735 [Bacteroidota bacterium]
MNKNIRIGYYKNRIFLISITMQFASSVIKIQIGEVLFLINRRVRVKGKRKKEKGKRRKEKGERRKVKG